MHKVAGDAGDPDRLYAQNHFGVYRTDDDGDSWTSIADGLPADFGFPIVASPAHAAARPGWCRWSPTCSGSRRTAGCAVHRTARRRGRPGPSCGDGPARRRVDAVLRDAFCADAGDPTGVYVGTRDGCVYASADEGDSFTLVADAPARRAVRRGAAVLP